ncbi:MAG: TraB/GumN family protein [Ectothiorhodospiraceae bacterium]|nr:TraB/GumN family protein [Ectothiorhodospiraceae bacterium]
MKSAGWWRWVSVMVAVLAAPSASAGPSLWHVRGADGEALLFGSVHFRSADAEPLPAAVRDAVEAADRLAVELDPDRISADVARETMARLGLSGPDITVEDVLVGEERERMRGALERVGLPADALDGARPWLAAITLTVAALERFGYVARTGVDREAIATARGAGVPVVALERFEDQLGAIAGLPVASQRWFLLDAVEQVEAEGAHYRELLAAWDRGDDAKLDGLVGRGLDRGGEHHVVWESLVGRRNRAMLEAVVELLREPGLSVVVVGAGHLVGEEGLVETLARRGYRVTRR